MWRTSEPVKTFAGALSLVLAYGLSDMLEWMETSLDDDADENDYLPEIERFANLTLEQKAWTVHLVTFGLLDRKTPTVPLTAYSEATVATIFRTVEDMVQSEISFIEDDPDCGCYYVRRAIWTVYEESGHNSPDYLVEDEPLKVECSDMEQWKEAIYDIEFSILWDTDYDFTTFEDDPPELAALKRAHFTIDDNYFVAIPDDPHPAEAKRLIQEARKLCARVIKREEKKLQKG
ncbi:MAG: hypothetical protein LBI05_05725 [Planctomycetaceae bacterium]|jgi:hypothetical protein|nr:hypothetical protein [Planctomycetaceae bacterium]